jgi:hypothetical protein
MELKLLKEKIEEELKAQRVSGRTLLDKFCVIEENSRKSPAYADPTYSCFYYHLGKYIKPMSVLEIGFDLGLLSGSFFTSNKTATRFFGFREKNKEFASVRLGRQNIRRVMKGQRDFYIGELYDESFENLFNLCKWDLVILTDEANYDKTLEYLDFVWPNVSSEGIIVCEYLSRSPAVKDAFTGFCKSKNREFVQFSTRYQVGLVQK